MKMKLSEETKEKIVMRLMLVTGFFITGIIWSLAISFIIKFIGDLI